MRQYQYWGSENNAPPENLKTTKQTEELGFKPKKAVGFIETKKYTILLYDINDPESVKPKKKASSAQLRALEKAKEARRIKKLERDWCRFQDAVDAPFLFDLPREELRERVPEEFRELFDKGIL